MKQVKLMVAGILLGATLTAVAQCGMFDEATAAKQAKTAWCAGTCDKSQFRDTLSKQFK